jgi:excisionase family DNA binding protein
VGADLSTLYRSDVPVTDELLGVDEAADYLTVSRRTLYREMDRKALRWTVVRGRRRIRRSELERYLRVNERGRAA